MKALILGMWMVAIVGISLAVSAPTDEGDQLGFVSIESPNNPADSNGCGKVGYVYRITRQPIDNQTYVKFLNAADPGGTNGKSLYNPKMMLSPQGGIIFDQRAREGRKYQVKPGAAKSPVAFVGWADAARFSNWLSNGGQKGSSTEVGAYNLRTSKGNLTERHKGSRYCIPNKDELYKAAFYLPASQGRTSSDQLYVNLADGVNPVGFGAISLPILNGMIPELVDPYAVSSSEPQWTLPNQGVPAVFKFSGESDPFAENDTVGFRLASIPSGEEYAERASVSDEYAGAPDMASAGFTPSFPLPASGSGAGARGGGFSPLTFDLPPSS